LSLLWLSRLFAKTGATGRRQLAQAVRQGLLDLARG
jgi:hypothetical protein